MRKQTDRRELAAPFDALSWALCLKNRRAARALLEKREVQTWIEGSEYAPLTLGWAPELLEMFLARGNCELDEKGRGKDPAVRVVLTLLGIKGEAAGWELGRSIAADAKKTQKGAI